MVEKSGLVKKKWGHMSLLGIGSPYKMTPKGVSAGRGLRQPNHAAPSSLASTLAPAPRDERARGRSIVLLLAGLLALTWDACAGGVIRKPQIRIDRTRPQIWLQSGPQTAITPAIAALAQRLKSPDPMVTLRRIHRWIFAHSRPFVGNKGGVLRRRTASELLADRALSGCGDWGTLLVALIRGARLPAVYVESIHKQWARDWVEGTSFGPYMGHVFIEVSVKGKWILIDSTRGYYWTGYDPNVADLPLGYYAFAKGIDDWALGLKSFSGLRRSLEALADTLADTRFKTVHYRRGYLTPTVLFIGPAAVAARIAKAHPNLRLKAYEPRVARRIADKLARKYAGVDMMIVETTPSTQPSSALHQSSSAQRASAQPRDLTWLTHILDVPSSRLHAALAASTARGNRGSATVLRAGHRFICLVTAPNPSFLVKAVPHLLSVRPDRDHALSTQTCRWPASVMSRTTGRPKPPRPQTARPATTRTGGAPARPGQPDAKHQSKKQTPPKQPNQTK
ncbi:MAG: hypothetical protein J7M25_00030 [Deltaproteobacteria bacterium]|nr:hypothetical protein [Deltaproteobacteria bacterium]